LSFLENLAICLESLTLSFLHYSRWCWTFAWLSSWWKVLRTRWSCVSVNGWTTWTWWKVFQHYNATYMRLRIWCRCWYTRRNILFQGI